MRKYLPLLLLSFLIPATAFSQYYWDYGGQVGLTNYLGKIGGLEKTAQPFILDMKLPETRWDIGGYVRYKLRDPFLIEADLDLLRISGADSLSTNPGRRGRNLNFRNTMVSLAVKGMWTFYENSDLGHTYRFRNSFNSYLFLGVGMIYQNPQGYGDPPGGHGTGWYYLEPLHTGGENGYSLFVPTIPMGAGMYFTLSKIYRIGWELGWNYTFSRYLDDIGTDYPSAAQWANMSPEAQYFSNRNPQLSPSAQAQLEQQGVAYNNYGPGNTRGVRAGEANTLSRHESYLTSIFSFGYVIRGRSNFYRQHYKGIFNSHYHIRRNRAKF
ncbi:MAG: hypothetical protein HKL88_01420 [Bacteroidia bacterium]|nr:hypothetical protein [Bacteroidia bacterium]